MHSLKIIIFFGGILLIQISVLPALLSPRYLPALPLSALIWLIFYGSRKEAFVFALIAGLAFDLYDAPVFGSHIAGMLAAYAIGSALLSGALPKDERLDVVAAITTAMYISWKLLAWMSALGIASWTGRAHFPFSYYLGISSILPVLITYAAVFIIGRAASYCHIRSHEQKSF